MEWLYRLHNHTMSHLLQVPYQTATQTAASKQKPLQFRGLSSSRPRTRPMHSLSALDKPLQYPIARRDDTVIDDYHGVKIADPYRWLEDPDAEEVKRVCAGARNKYFHFHNTGLQAQNVLYVQDSLEGEPDVLLDPNGLSVDGTVSLNSETLSVSEDAKYLAYGLSTSGSDWVTIKVMRVEDKIVEADTLYWAKFTGISWTHDGKRIFLLPLSNSQRGRKLRCWDGD
ncbi:PROLYL OLIGOPEPTIDASE FAMILY PROTEIN [Salix koriyanagi]|uniref:PROLYL OLIGOPEPTIDASE FAMILY PROTEIN n=1 Tax=Salix koriyanagi TaxID=2511006 RepID=A0A9Q0SKP4_9ROSI|nr:PROLYL OLIGOPEPTIDASE FAMILY PROTEIN [Salix koriyanagi]